MGHPRKRNTSQDLSVHSAVAENTRSSSRRIRLSSRDIPPAVDRNGTKAVAPTFFEDFTLEHCLPGPHVTAIALSGSF